jgi:hypothetical protein
VAAGAVAGAREQACCRFRTRGEARRLVEEGAYWWLRRGLICLGPGLEQETNFLVIIIFFYSFLFLFCFLVLGIAMRAAPPPARPRIREWMAVTRGEQGE